MKKRAEYIHLLSKYHLILDNSQEIILFYNSKGKIIDCNKKAKEELGYQEDIYHTAISDIFKNVFIYEDNQLMSSVTFHNTPKEVIVYRKNQTCFPAELTISVLRKKCHVIGVCSAVNLSSYKESERLINILKSRINDSNQMSSEFFAKVAHELRTPLNGIIGFTGNLMDMNLQTDQLEAVNLIKKCSDTLKGVLNDLMDYERISENKLLIENREFGFRRFIQNIVSFNIGSINDKGLKLQVYISKDIPDRLVGDEFRLTQVLNNLVANAVKFTSVGQIGLEVMKVLLTDTYIELLFMVNDTGIGIDNQEKDKLFRSFYQIDNSITRKYQGTGLGLSICKHIIETMNGTITVDSEKDKGSTFLFTVRLGLPQQFSGECSEKEELIHNADMSTDQIGEDIKENEISEMDYISKRLKNITKHDRGNHIDNAFKEDIDMNEILEELTICIEMENWGRSEQLACKMKASIQNYQYISSRDVLRLLFAIRKENHDVSLSIINEIKARMIEETE